MVWCLVCGVWCVMCDVSFVVCGVWCVVWCVVCDAFVCVSLCPRVCVRAFASKFLIPRHCHISSSKPFPKMRI